MGSIGCLYPNGSNHRPADDDDDDDDDFSFSSCHNFGSSYLQVLSEEEGDLVCDSDDESYIEIQLQHSKPSSVNGDAQDTSPFPDVDDDDEEHIELRISISSRAVPFPQRFISASTESEADTLATSSSFVTTTSLNSSTMSSYSMPGFLKNGYPCQGEEVMMASEETLSELGCRGDDIKVRRTRTRNRSRRLQFPAINRLLTALLSSLKISPEMCQETPASRNPSISDLELLRPRNNFSRKASSRNSTTTNSSIMMKFLIKFRATQFGSFLTSFMKSRQAVPPPGRHSKGSEKKEENKHEVNFQFHTRTPERKETNEKRRKPNLSVLEINLNNGMKGVIEAVRVGRKSHSSSKKMKKKMKKNSDSSDEKKSSSCPTSTKSSPLHRDGKIHLGESSIQAAIAHCKNSFAFFPDFRFDPVTMHP